MKTPKMNFNKIMARAKTSILTGFLTFLGIFIPSLDGQELFAPLNTEWNFAGDSENSFVSYRAEKELVVSGKNCVQINVYFYDKNTDVFIRQDDSLIVHEDNGKVFFHDDGSFYMMFDFSAELGDSITLYSRNDELGNFGFNCEDGVERIVPTDFVVSEVNEVALGQRRRVNEFVLSPISYPLYIHVYQEYIGMVDNPDNPFPNFFCSYVPPEGFPGLRCLIRDEFDYKPYQPQKDSPWFFEHPTCRQIMNTQNILDDHDILISVDNQWINLGTDENISGLSLYNASGKLIRVFDKNERQLYISDLSNGMYVLMVSLDQGIVREKVLLR